MSVYQRQFPIGLLTFVLTKLQRLGMMTLLGQHGQPQDYRRGVELIKLSADTADENAPQGAYVRHSVRTSRANTDNC